jgi:hypothetical protein
MSTLALVIGYIVLAGLAVSIAAALVIGLSWLLFCRLMKLTLAPIGSLLPWAAVQHTLGNISGDMVPMNRGDDATTLVKAPRLQKELYYRAFQVSGQRRPWHLILMLLPTPLLCLLARAIGRQPIGWSWDKRGEDADPYQYDYRALRVSQGWLIGCSSERFVLTAEGHYAPVSRL